MKGRRSRPSPATAGLAVVYLVAPTTPPDRRAAVAARSGGFLYCVSLVGVTGARSALPSTVGAARPRCPGGVAGPGRRRVRRQHAGPCRGDREGRRRWRDRRLSAGRCSRPGRSRHRGPGRLVRTLRVPQPPEPARRRPVSLQRDEAALEIAEEAAAKKAFAWAVDWPGWCRAGKDADLARTALLDYASRYGKVAKAAGLELPDLDGGRHRHRRTVDGGTGTEFGVPSAITHADRRKVTPPRPNGWPGSSRRPGRSSTVSPRNRRRSFARAREAVAATATR